MAARRGRNRTRVLVRLDSILSGCCSARVVDHESELQARYPLSLSAPASQPTRSDENHRTALNKPPSVSVRRKRKGKSARCSNFYLPACMLGNAPSKRKRGRVCPVNLSLGMIFRAEPCHANTSRGTRIAESSILGKEGCQRLDVMMHGRWVFEHGLIVVW